MSTNDPQRKIPTPADLDPARPLRDVSRAVTAEQPTEEPPTAPTPASVAPTIATPEFVRPSGVELSEEQRIRVEALHAARRVLGNPYMKDGQIPTGWSWQAIELASYIVTGDADRAAYEEDEEPAQAAPAVVDLAKPLPAGLPPAVAATLQKLQGAILTSPEDRAKRARDYIEQYRDKPDGLKELNAQGYFPVDGSEPPRSEPLHDVHCARWTYNTKAARWVRDIQPEDGRPGPDGPIRTQLTGPWGQELAEFGPFHVCI